LTDVRKLLPLKQGLKLAMMMKPISQRFVRKLLPLKQGLKHQRGYLLILTFKSSEAPSIKTRIETYQEEKK